MQDDKIVEVVNTHACRTLLLCERHVALVRCKNMAVRSTYKSMWVVPISEIKIVRGTDPTSKPRCSQISASPYEAAMEWQKGIWSIVCTWKIDSTLFFLAYSERGRDDRTVLNARLLG